MGGRSKALAMLAGRSLLQHVIDRLAPQVAVLMLSVERGDPALEEFGLHQVPDPALGSNGPLGGLLSAIEATPAGCEWLLLVPCDAPFAPLDLAARLFDAAARHGSSGAVARYGGELQPTFSLWHRGVLPALRDAVLHDGMGGFKEFLAVCPLPAADWPESDLPPFFNVNTPDDLLQAERLVRAGLG